MKYFTSQLFWVEIFYDWKKSNEITARQTRTSLGKHDVIKVCSIEYLTTQIELVLPTFFQLLDRSQNYRIFNVRGRLLSSLGNIYHSTTAYFFDPPCILTCLRTRCDKAYTVLRPAIRRVIAAVESHLWRIGQDAGRYYCGGRQVLLRSDLPWRGRGDSQGGRHPRRTVPAPRKYHEGRRLRTVHMPPGQVRRVSLLIPTTIQGGPKKAINSWSWLCQNLNRCTKLFFTGRFLGKCAVNWLFKISPLLALCCHTTSWNINVSKLAINDKLQGK